MPVTVVSLGDYVLNGGEVAVLAMVEAVGRLLPGVVGNAESLVEESHEDGLLEYPVYTRPASWDDAGTVREVPAVLLSGDHGAIAAWRHQQRLERTAARRPDLLPVSATTGALADLDVRVAVPADAAELLVLQRACWVREGLAARGRWVVPPLAEELDDVAARAGGVDDVCRARARRRGRAGTAGRLGAGAAASRRRHALGGGPPHGGARPPGARPRARAAGARRVARAGRGHRLRADHRGARGGQPAVLQAGPATGS